MQNTMPGPAPPDQHIPHLSDQAVNERFQAIASAENANDLRIRGAAVGMMLEQSLDMANTAPEMSAEDAARAYNEATGRSAQEDTPPQRDWIAEAEAELADNPDAGKNALEAIEQDLQNNAQRVIANAEYGLGNKSTVDWHRDLDQIRAAEQEQVLTQQRVQQELATAQENVGLH